jgi:GNAT superfamily N-acetyltransferase
MQIRALRCSDEAQWRALWAAYIAFQGGSVLPHVTDHTWARLTVSHPVLIGRVAEMDGAVCGFSISLLHEGTWSTAPYCYLEDLYVAESMRGQGIGRALIEDLVQLRDQNGWQRLYWHTRGSNAVARKLYDRFTPADGDVRYRLERC